MNEGSEIRGGNSWRRRTMALAAVVAVLGGLLAWTSPASAHWPEVGRLNIECRGPDLVLEWEAVSWNLVDSVGTHPDITVELSLDGGPFTVIGSGAFTDANGRRFSGVTPIPLTATVIRVQVRASDAPWDGTNDTGGSRWKNIHNTIRSCEEAAESAPEPVVEPTVAESTPVPTVAEPTVAEPTPEPVVEPTVAESTREPDVVEPTVAESTPEPSPEPAVVEPTVAESTPEPTVAPTAQPAVDPTPAPARPTPAPLVPTQPPAVASPTPDDTPVILLPTLPSTPEPETKPGILLPTLPSTPEPAAKPGILLPTLPAQAVSDEPEVLGEEVSRDELANTGADWRLLSVVSLGLLVGGGLLVLAGARLRYRRT